MLRSKVNSILGIFGLACPAILCAQVSGVVVDANQRPVTEVEVIGSDGNSEERRLSGEGGIFKIELSPPLQLIARKLGFGEVEVAVTAGTSEVRMQLPLAPYVDELVVAAKDDSLGIPRTASLATITPGEGAAGTSITDLVSHLPSVSQNGQGGLFQVFSIRGLSRHRVLTLMDGVRIVSDRRAGSSTSFADPHLIDGVEVLRGPASSRFGSGALGGVVQLVPRTNHELRAHANWQSQGSQTALGIGWGDQSTSLDLAYRRSGNTETPERETLFSQYRQTSLLAGHRWGTTERNYRVRLMGSSGRNIGKVSTDFPSRITRYPEETHWLGRFVASSARNSWSIAVHPSVLRTEVVDAQLSQVVNRAADGSLSWNRTEGTERGRYLWGADLFVRNGVRASETLAGVTTTTLDGGQLEASGYATWERPTEKATFSVGGRWTTLRQSQDHQASATETSGSAFVGWAVNLGQQWDVRFHTGSGWRFPSLSERFFRGSTGRGQVIGNPDLKPERSLSAESGLRWTGARAYVDAGMHYNRVDDYIERFDLGEVRSFDNVDSGSIWGFEVAGAWSISRTLGLDWGGHLLQGEADNGDPLADIPPDRAWASVHWSPEDWSVKSRLEHRLRKSDLGPGELELGSATLLSFKIERSHRLGVVSVYAENLLDQTYRTAADDKLPPSAGATVGVSWRWMASSNAP